MKPKDLKFPYNWEERRPIVQDGLLFIPDFYSDHHLFSWDPHSVFPCTSPLAIEYCSGNGSWLVERARAQPETNWIGVEIRFDRVRKLWAKMKNQNLSNLFIVCGEALTFTEHYLPADSLDQVFINFPDPWPKTRHEKHRLMQSKFLDQLGRIVKKEGKITFVTDDTCYLTQTLRQFLSRSDLQSLHPPPYFAVEKTGYGTSFFDTLWREKGRNIHFLEFIKT